MNIFIELSIIIFIATVLSWLMKLLKQLSIIGYIITGIIVVTFSRFGVVFLLFIAGLSLSPNVLKKLGRISLIGGLTQILLIIVFGFIVSLYLGFNSIEAIFISIALTFSSTIIV